MRRLTSTLTVLVFLSACASARPDSSQETIDILVTKLGSERYSERATATAALDKCGEAALPALRAALAGGEPEVRERAAILIQRIEGRLESARLIAATKTRLVFKDLPVLDAVREFAAKTGMRLEFQGNFDRAGIGERKVTLDTGETTFWNAFDQFCRAAGLEQCTTNPSTTNAGRPTLGSPIQGIALADAKSAPVPATAVGAIRFRAVPPAWVGQFDNKQPGPNPEFVGFHLEVTPEPKMKWQDVLSLHVTHAIDSACQELVQPEPYHVEQVVDPLFGMDALMLAGGRSFPMFNDFSNSCFLLAKFTPGKKASRNLKEVRGTATIQVSTTQALLTVNEPHKFLGKKLTAKDGSTIILERIEQKDRELTVKLRVTNGSQSVMAGFQPVQVFRNKNGVMFLDNLATTLPFEVDDTSGKMPIPVNVKTIEYAVGGFDAVLAFTLADAKSAISTLRYTGPRIVTVEVPFTLHDVPLCDDPKLPVNGGYGGIGGFGGGMNGLGGGVGGFGGGAIIRGGGFGGGGGAKGGAKGGGF